MSEIKTVTKPIQDIRFVARWLSLDIHYDAFTNEQLEEYLAPALEHAIKVMERRGVELSE